MHEPNIKIIQGNRGSTVVVSWDELLCWLTEQPIGKKNHQFHACVQFIFFSTLHCYAPTKLNGTLLSSPYLSVRPSATKYREQTAELGGANFGRHMQVDKVSSPTCFQSNHFQNKILGNNVINLPHFT